MSRLYSKGVVRELDRPSDSEEPAYHETLVPPGNYHVEFVREERGRYFDRDVWFVFMKIVDPGPDQGLLLLYPINALPEGKRPSPRCSIFDAYLVATGRKPPADFWRIRPSSFLAGQRFLACVRTITQNASRIERPEAGHYSRVKCLIRVVEGQILISPGEDS